MPTFRLSTVFTSLSSLAVLCALVGATDLSVKEKVGILCVGAVSGLLTGGILFSLVKTVRALRLSRECRGIVLGVGTAGALYGSCIGGIFAMVNVARPMQIFTVTAFAFGFAAIGLLLSAISAGMVACAVGILRRSTGLPWNNHFDGAIIGVVVGASLLNLIFDGIPTQPTVLLARGILPAILGALMGYIGQTTLRECKF